jgi:glucose uptake protein
MGSFYPLVAKAMRGDHSVGPYAVAVVFALGVAASALVVNSLFMRWPLTATPPVSLRDYWTARPQWHFWGWIGGLMWCSGLVLNLVASSASIVGPAVSYAIGQGATMISAFWGVFIWREFAKAPAAARRLLWPMFVCFLVGLGLIAIAPLR